MTLNRTKTFSECFTTFNSLALWGGLGLSLVGIGSISGHAAGVEFGGYLRSGMGFGSGGRDSLCFRAPGSSATFRLGNECDTYAETALTQPFAAGPREAAVTVRAAWMTAGHRGFESTAGAGGESTLKVALPEVYGITRGAGPHFWVGKRFYRRYDIHILDYYYLNNSGPGAGVEDIALPWGELHVAVLRNIPDPDQKGGPPQTQLDLRLAKVGGGVAQHELVVIAGQSTAQAHSGGDEWEPRKGVQVAAIQDWQLPPSWALRTVLQVGQGLYGANASGRSSALGAFGAWGEQASPKGTSLTAKDASRSYRILADLHGDLTAQTHLNGVVVWEHLDFGGARRPEGSADGELIPTTHLNGVVVWEHLDFGGARRPEGSADGELIPTKEETLAGGRVLHSLGSGFAIVGEYGFAHVARAYLRDSPESGYADASLHKVTVAPQVAAGDGTYWSRPALRVFATYASWDRESEGKVGPGRSHLTLGTQVEAWW